MRISNLLILAVMLLTAVAPLSSAEDKIVLSGEYEWNNGGSDELTAEFTPTGAGKWDVEFRFRFSGKGNTWNGTALGDLSDGGELTGTATWKKSGRHWVFSGVMQDGELRGSHAEVRGEQESASGTFRLEASSD